MVHLIIIEQVLHSTTLYQTTTEIPSIGDLVLRKIENEIMSIDKTKRFCVLQLQYCKVKRRVQ